MTCHTSTHSPAPRELPDWPLLSHSTTIGASQPPTQYCTSYCNLGDNVSIDVGSTQSCQLWPLAGTLKYALIGHRGVAVNRTAVLRSMTPPYPVRIDRSSQRWWFWFLFCLLFSSFSCLHLSRSSPPLSFICSLSHLPPPLALYCFYWVHPCFMDCSCVAPRRWE